LWPILKLSQSRRTEGGIFAQQHRFLDQQHDIAYRKQRFVDEKTRFADDRSSLSHQITRLVHLRNHPFNQQRRFADL
jgi:hypothetical protein